jgi:hypothetical protein
MLFCAVIRYQIASICESMYFYVRPASWKPDLPVEAEFKRLRPSLPLARLDKLAFGDSRQLIR